MFKKIVMITAFSLVVSACGDGGAVVAPLQSGLMEASVVWRLIIF